MSAAEIMAQLPNLTAEERQALARRLRELDEQDEMQFLHEAAVETFREMDRTEAPKSVRPLS